MSDTGLMTAAPDTDVALIELQALSPEVVLVDPDLAASARPLLAEPDARVEIGEPSRDEQSEPSALIAKQGFRSEAIAEARQRLMEAGLASEVVGAMLPSGRYFRRRATLIPASSAA